MLNCNVFVHAVGWSDRGIWLLCGIEKFDASRGFKISTYVYWCIHQVRADYLVLQ
jgi:hypothetical protein